jgi:NAD(P)-dependent dehydrogenase (short-subunit alcohol dehydrogenase family)
MTHPNSFEGRTVVITGASRDIAHTALFLAGDGARFITGQSVVVDCGQTLPEIPATGKDER